MTDPSSDSLMRSHWESHDATPTERNGTNEETTTAERESHVTYRARRAKQDSPGVLTGKRHCSTCDCHDEGPIPGPATSSEWARRQAREAAAAAIRAAKDRRKKPQETT